MPDNRIVFAALVAAIASLAPSTPIPAAEPANTRHVTKLAIPYRDAAGLTPAEQERCRLDVHHPAEGSAAATVVWFHGGGLTQGSREVPQELRDRGITVVGAGYRLANDGPARRCIEDAAAAVAWTIRHAAEFGGRPERVYVAGHSAGAYLSLMVALDRQWLAACGADADTLAGVVAASPQAITHFKVRAERGIADTRPIIDEFAPLYHVRKDAPPILLVTGDREREMLGRYEENAYFARMLRIVGHDATTLHELQGFDHGGMAKPAQLLLLDFVRREPAPAPQTTAPADAPEVAKFEPDIRAFEEADRRTPPPENAILFLGSSSIRLWDTIEQDLDMKPIVRRGYGGARYRDLCHYASRLVAAQKPRAIVVFAANDIGDDAEPPPERVLIDVRATLGQIRKIHPTTPVFFVAVTPTPARWKSWPLIQQLNAGIEALCRAEADTAFVPTAERFLDPATGRPRAELFQDDRLHLSPEGYAVWAELISAAVTPR